jgi:hypothetical protein
LPTAAIAPTLVCVLDREPHGDAGVVPGFDGRAEYAGALNTAEAVRAVW